MYSNALISCNVLNSFDQLTCLGPPGVHHITGDNVQDRTEHAKSITINACKPPVIHITGVATNCRKDVNIFELDVKQYISCFKDASSASNHMTPFKCSFPASPKYKNGTLMPWNKRYVTILGTVTGVETDTTDLKKPTIQYFNVDIRNIAFAGQYMPAATTSMSPASGSAQRK